MKDLINSDHYKTETLEAIEVMRAFCSDEEFTGHLRCTAIKYLLRLHKKDTPRINAEKCKWYVERLIKELQ